MLNRDAKMRLGAKGEANQILAHPWFQDLDRDKMIKKELKTPFKPKVEGEDWMEGFDKEFTSEKPIYDDKGEKSEADRGEYEKLFKGF